MSHEKLIPQIADKVKTFAHVDTPGGDHYNERSNGIPEGSIVLRTAALLLVVLLALAPQAALRADPMKPVYLDSKAAPQPANGGHPGDAAKPAPPVKIPAEPQAPLEIDKKNGRLSIAGKFTGTPGNIELGACAKGGKTHLAALVLEVRPSRIAEAMAEIGVAAGQVPVADREAGTATTPKGRQVLLFVQWHVKEKNEVVLRRARLEELFWNRSDDKVLAEAAWTYAGGKLVRDEAGGDGLFTANVSGSVATIERFDTSALFYYGGDLGPTAAWSANPNLRPAEGTPCRLIVEPAPEEKPVENTSPAQSDAKPPEEPKAAEVNVPESLPAPAPVIEKPPVDAPPAPSDKPSPAGPAETVPVAPPVPALDEKPDRSVP